MKIMGARKKHAKLLPYWGPKHTDGQRHKLSRLGHRTPGICARFDFKEYL